MSGANAGGPTIRNTGLRIFPFLNIFFLEKIVLIFYGIIYTWVNIYECVLISICMF